MTVLNIILLTFLNGCTGSIDRSSNNAVIAQDSVLNPVQYLVDSNLEVIIHVNSHWFSSWNWNSEKLSIDDMKLEWEKPLELSWSAYDPKNPHINSFDTLLIPSKSGLAIDMYSYNTVLEKIGDSVIVDIGVDSKVYIVNKGAGERAELVHTGSYEVIEEAFWLGPQTVCLMGYLSEDTYAPFLWFFDLKRKQQIFYRLVGESLSDQRASFLLKKHPYMTLRK